ncbi:peroxidase family protein [Nitrospira sp. Nam80]
MARPVFLWDLILRLLLGFLAVTAAILFWLLTPFFLVLNLLVSWHHLWRYIGVWNLVIFRFIMRRRNLFDTGSLATKPQPPDLRSIQWNPQWRTARTADGTFNDLHDPSMGRAETRFGRNFPLGRLAKLFARQKQEAKLLSPNPRQISKDLLTRDRFRPASSLNLLAAAWIQFQVHDWVAHRRRPPAAPSEEKTDKDYLPSIPLDPDDDWPGRESVPKAANSCIGREREGDRPDRNNSAAYVMRIRRTEEDDSVDRESDSFPAGLKDLPLYRNTETHWWDGSQLYGSSLAKQRALRSPKGDGKLWMENMRLPREPGRHGFDLTGFNDNYWAGLSLLHTLFALEHNAICDRLKEEHPVWDDERLFQTARLINVALMAKIHTVEWTPAILGHPTLYIGMRANWWGIVTRRFNKIIGRLRFLRDIQEEITGIPASEQDHHAAAFAMTEEFVSVYRMHPLIPDEYRIYSVEEDELQAACTLNDLHGDRTRDFIGRHGFENVFYSFGVSHPGAVTLRNFPRALQQFRRMHDGQCAIPEGEMLDLASVDIMRDRERAIPRYNNFRRMLMLLPCISYERLVGVPFTRWFSGLTNREIDERKSWARELRRLYPDKEDLDLMLGLFAENRPKGFGFSDTAFRIFVLMAPRRLKSDRFITTDFNADVYTQPGMDWIEDNDFKSVLLRHYPSLAPALDDVSNAFTPWRRTERPSPDPVESLPMSDDPRPAMRRMAAFQMPIFGGALVGWIFGAVLHTSTAGGRFFDFFASLITERAAHGAAMGAIIGGFCLASIYAFTYMATRQLTLREKVQTGAGWGATAGWFIGALYHLWSTDSVLPSLTQTALTTTGSLLTKEATIGALLGAGSGAILRRISSQIARGAVVGWVVGAAWYLWHKGGVSLAALARDLYLAGKALGTSEALIVAFVGALIGIAYAAKGELRAISTPAAVRRLRWRAAYGIVFGGGIGAITGILIALSKGVAQNPLFILVTAAMALSLLIAGITMYAVRDSLNRHERPRAYSLLADALIGTTIAALLWFIVRPADGINPLLQAGRSALDALTFHAAAGAAFGSIIGLALWTGGWVTVAAAAGWLLGAVISCIDSLQGEFSTAVLSSDAGTATVIGAFLGTALMTFFVREGGWIVVGALRGAVIGIVLGTFYHLWHMVSAANALETAIEASKSWPAIWGALIAALLVGSIWLVQGPEITWLLRRSFWSLWGWFKFIGNRPLTVAPPRRRAWWKIITWLRMFADRRARAANKNGSSREEWWQSLKSLLDYCLRRSGSARRLDKIPLMEFSEKFGIPIRGIHVSGAIPADERSRMKSLFYRIQVHLYSVFPPMQPKELPPISADPHKALTHAYGFLHRRAFDAPDLPPEYEGSPDLGALAVRGPYSAFLQQAKDSSDEDPLFEWDLRDDLHRFESHPELYSLGVRVLFKTKRDTIEAISRLAPYQIEYQTAENNPCISRPSAPDWQFAKKLALCAVTTHQSLVRHFNWVHLAGGEPFAIATRRTLPSDHFLCRFLWPHIYGTQQSNTVVTRGQMVKGGDFEEIFSFTHEGMCDLFSKTYGDFDLIVNDPEMDARRRGVRDYLRSAGIETSQENLEDLFEVMHRHAKRYLLLYYTDDGSIARDERLETWFRGLEQTLTADKTRWQEDKALQDWLGQLSVLMPPHKNHIKPCSLAEIARLLAQLIYLVTVEHDKCGSSLWNYQLWSHRQPCRVYKKGTREPLDVYQRLVNANFNLNVTRLSLMEDFSYLALDDEGAAAFREFRRDLETLQKEMEKKPWAVWKLYPRMLEANINA